MKKKYIQNYFLTEMTFKKCLYTIKCCLSKPLLVSLLQLNILNKYEIKKKRSHTNASRKNK